MRNGSQLIVHPNAAALLANRSACWYSILGVANSAEAADIARAYKKLALRYHPDKQRNKFEEEQAEAAAQYQLVEEAYRVLSDPKLRAKYDLEVHPYQPRLTPVFIDPPKEKNDLGDLPDSLGRFADDKFQAFVRELDATESPYLGCWLGEMQAAWLWARYYSLDGTEKDFTSTDYFLLFWLSETKVKAEPDFALTNYSYQGLQFQLNKIWLNHLGLQALAWVNIIQSVHAYRDGALSETALRQQVAFVSAKIRDGKNYFKDFYDYLYAPILCNKSRLETIQKIRGAKGEAPSKRCAQKIAQLDLVLNEIRAILHSGVRELMDLHKNQIKDGGSKNNEVLEARRREIFIKAADKIREFEKKPEIAKNRNRVSRFLKGLLLAIPAALLALPCVLTKTTRRAWMSMFYYNETEQALKSARRKLLEAKGPAPGA